jgi:UDP-glucose 4-epimerase
MRLLVTGAAGLVGGAIARRAVERGHDVIRLWHRAPLAPLKGAQDLQCDLEDPTSVASLPTEVGGVIHAAARIPAGNWSDDAAATANRINDDGLLNHYAEAAYAGAWVYVSSVSLEHAESRSSRYAMEKAETEGRAAIVFPGRMRSLRISSPYGPGMRHMNVLRRFADAARSGQPITVLGTGERTQDFVHVDDVAAAALAAIDAPGGDPVTVASGEAVSMSALARLIVQIAGSSSSIEHASRSDPQDGFRAEYDLRPAFDALGWVPVIRLEVGLRSMLAAM